MYEEIHEIIKKLSEKRGEIENRAIKENRPLTARETGLIVEFDAEINEQRKNLPVGSPLTLQGFGGGRSVRSTDTGGFKDMGEFMSALYRKSRGEGFDSRLEPLQVRASIGESVPSEGGFAVPNIFVERALNENLEDTVLLQLCDRQIMTTNAMTCPAFVDNSHLATAPFGITWTQIAEAGSWGTLQGTPFRSMELNAHKSGALFLVSNEWLADTSAGIRQRLENIWRASLRWYIEDLLWTGTGAGQALGALTGSGALSIPKESGQRADTIVTENVVNMWARLRPGSHSRAIWACNASCFPMLATLSLSVGTGGVPVSLLTTNQGSGIAGAPSTAILGRPLYISEHLPALGDSGDLVLCDPSLYLLADRQQIVLDVSPHVRFESDQTVFRASARLDAQPIYSSVLTPKNGPTAGWLVKIAERA
jgi:HK97 family phage major capsid protein